MLPWKLRVSQQSLLDWRKAGTRPSTKNAEAPSCRTAQHPTRLGYCGLGSRRMAAEASVATVVNKLTSSHTGRQESYRWRVTRPGRISCDRTP